MVTFRLFLYAMALLTVLLPILFITSYGHGVGSETMPPVMIGGRNVTLAIGQYQTYVNPENDKEISLQLFETNSKNPVNDVTYFVKAIKGNSVLFEHTFQSDTGNLIMIIKTTKSDNVSVQEGSLFAKVIAPLFGASDAAVISGPIFGTGGLYQFHIEVLTADSYNKLDSPIKYDAAISIPETTTYQINDNEYGEQKIGIITYYDQISNFQYDSQSKSIKFAMPFDWSESNINQVAIVHEEVLIPKSFGNLLVTKYIAYINDLPLPDNAVTIDDYSADDRTIHIVLNKSELQDLAKIREKSKQGMEFTLQSSDEDKFPITAFTRNAQYKVNLEWDPPKIVAGSNTKFYFKVLDPYLINKTVASVSYDFSVIQNQQVIFKKSGVTIDSQTEDNIIDVFIPDDSAGPIIIAFENLGGNSFAGVEFTSVVTKPDTNHIFPIKLSSFSTESGSKILGKYDVDLTWFPSTIQIDQQSEFVFTIKDKNTGNVVPQSSYDFVILQKGNEVFRKSGIATAGGDYVDYTFSNGQGGPTVLRIENINNSGETAEIPFVVTPEFPLGLLPVIMLGFFSTIIFSRLNKIQFRNFVNWKRIR